MIDNKFFLIEDALNNLEKILLNKFSLIDNLSIKITKPSILSDCKVSVSSKISSFS
jgi:dihydroneopterin aldolase